MATSSTPHPTNDQIHNEPIETELKENKQFDEENYSPRGGGGFGASPSRSDTHHDNSNTSEEQQHQEYLENQKFGPCLYFTGISIVSLLLVSLIFSPAISLLLFTGLLPCLLIFIVIYCLFRDKINLELSFHVLWSGAASVIPVFIVEIGVSLLFMLFLYGVNVLSIDEKNIVGSIEKQVDNLSFIWRIVFALFQSFVVSSFFEEVAKVLLALKTSSGGSLFSLCCKLGDNSQRLFYVDNYHPLPPMLYSSLAALGLSTIENLGYILVVSVRVYFLTANMPSQELIILQFGALTVIGRILLALPLHTLTGCLIGLKIVQYKIRMETQHLTEVPIFISSRYQENSMTIWRKIWVNIEFFCFVIYQPVLFHGLYDFILMINLHFAFSLVMCVVLVLVLFAVVVIMYRRLVVQWRT
ncbi:hypothetical protein C9374_010264 [Naegleria lovaniensis]|uniref:Transmembrane protein n=1 Tax=Naegleria lovaniensis TaxID=51637 RepID=A0AA88GG75_NAELO|nr:uncharacterized protein C9374_010264 [Naegleria lovaniensis]KAG2374890.1 hypothetical protein C9374_010264 [Naegleria lovaniensis]